MQALGLLATLATAACFRLAENRIPNSCSTQSGSSCVFPFSYQGVTHYQCTWADSPVPWCATQVSSDGSVVTNQWGDCDLTASSSCTQETLTPATCTATSGASCVFPFRYKVTTLRAVSASAPAAAPALAPPPPPPAAARAPPSPR